MPKRSRSHILEDESSAHFKNLLPSHWVFREMSKDYGSDGLIEIWEEDGKDAVPTGLFFNVQLKATDSSKLADKKKIKVKKSSFDYWLDQLIPTLLVRYSTHNSEPLVYSAWSYDYRIRILDSGKHCVLDFEDHDEWNGDTPGFIKESLLRDRLLKEPNLSLPIALDFIDRKRYRSEDDVIRQKLLPFAQYLKYKNPSSNEAVLKLRYRDDNLIISAGSRNAVGLGKVCKDRDGLGYDILLAVGLCLSFAEHHKFLSTFFEAAHEGSTMLDDPEVVSYVAMKLIDLGEVDQYRTLVVACLVQKADPLLVLKILWMCIDEIKKFPEKELEKHLKFLNEVTVTVKEIIPDLLGMVMFIKGTYLTSLYRAEEALDTFVETVEIDPRLTDNPFIWKQAANVVYWVGNFKEAARLYIRALRIEHEDNWETFANLADTQWRRGKLSSARYWLKKSLSNEDCRKDSRYHIFALLNHAINFAIDFLGSGRLEHYPDEVENEIFEREDEGFEFTDKEIFSLLKKDQSNFWLWGKSAFFHEKENPLVALNCRVIETFCVYKDPKKWAELFLDASLTKECDEDLKLLICRAAISIDPQSVADQIRMLSENNIHEDAIDLVNEIADNVEKVTKPELKRTIRPI